MALPSDWAAFLAAVRAQESGNYSEDTAGCLGAYCWSTQSGWDSMAAAAGQKQYVGVNPSQVPPSVQDKVASFNLYRAYQQGGGGSNGLAAAARWWNGGTTKSVPNPGLPSQPWARQCGGGSSGAYACQVLARMGLGGHYLSGSGSGAGGVVTTAAGAVADCAITLPSYHIGLFFGHGPSVGGQCLLTKSQVRGILAVGYMTIGGVLILNGLVLTLFATTLGKRVMQLVLAAPARGAAQATGGASSAAAQERQAAQGRAQWQRSIDRANRLEDEDALRRHRAQGEPRENRNLQARGGTVRSTDEQRAARKTRESAAGRAAARRAAGQGRPASRQETGF